MCVHGFQQTRRVSALLSHTLDKSSVFHEISLQYRYEE